MKFTRILIVLLLAVAAVVGWRLSSVAGKRGGEHVPEPTANAGPSALELGFSQVFMNRGVAAFERGEFGAAIERYADALALDPKNAKLYFLRGTAYWHRQQLGAAIADLSRAIEFGGQPQHYFSRCGAFFSVGEWDSAIVDCSESIQLAPMEADAYFLRAASYFSKGDLDRALVDCLVLLMIRPGDPNARHLLDDILELREKGGEPSGTPMLKTEIDSGG